MMFNFVCTEQVNVWQRLKLSLVTLETGKADTDFSRWTWLLTPTSSRRNTSGSGNTPFGLPVLYVVDLGLMFLLNVWIYFQGVDSCSETPVTFHYIKPSFMYIIEYLAFQVRPFIVNHLEVNTPTPTDAPPTTTRSLNTTASNITTTSTTKKA